MTDKTRGLNLYRRDKYEAAIGFLKEMMTMTRHMKATTKGPDPKSAWKPVQRGILMATQTVLDMQHFMLNIVGLLFFLPGRLTSDAIENLFSMIRQGNMKPNCLEFIYYLKIITIS